MLEWLRKEIDTEAQLSPGEKKSLIAHKTKQLDDYKEVIMSSPKHTPGPWNYYKHGPRGDNGKVKVETATEVIAVVAQRDEAEQFANARLIAAAPRLLAELKALADQFDSWVEHGDAAVEQPDTRDAWAAILEAEGGAE